MLNLLAEELASSDVGFSEEQYIISGGFPELYARPEIDPHFWYASYLATYLERDVRNIVNVGSLRDFDRFLRAIAIRTGQILSYSDLARYVGISPNTAKKWVSVLQASGQVFILEPYYRNIGKRLVKSPKIYMCDTGLASFLMGFEDWHAVSSNPVIGALWETHIVMQVVKYYASRGKSMPLWFWRTGYGDEVDLLIEKGGRFIAIEVKFSETPGTGDIKGLKALEKMYGHGSVIAGYVVSRVPFHHPIAEQYIAVPGSIISQYLSS